MLLKFPMQTNREAGTVACISAAMSRGAQIFRVHNVEAAWQTVKTLDVISRPTGRSYKLSQNRH